MKILKFCIETLLYNILWPTFSFICEFVLGCCVNELNSKNCVDVTKICSKLSTPFFRKFRIENFNLLFKSTLNRQFYATKICGTNVFDRFNEFHKNIYRLFSCAPIQIYSQFYATITGKHFCAQIAFILISTCPECCKYTRREKRLLRSHIVFKRL